jgi:fatty acyl-CoA reductase
MLTENVSIVFHVAATVRFDDPIHDAIIKNVRGTREVVQLAKQMKNILASKHKYYQIHFINIICQYI